MTVESQGVGLFGHVFTRPDQRRKGICDRIMRHQMADFRQRSGHVLLLGTGYQSPAYYIYEKHGFRDWANGSPGLMRYDAVPADVFEAIFFAPSALTPAALEWHHWPGAALLAALPTDVTLRSLTFGLWGVGLLEGPVCNFLYRYSGKPDARAGVLESPTGAVAAVATCVPDNRWPGVFLLDLFAHPSVTGTDLAALLNSLALPNAPFHCYADPNDAAKIAALKTAGFHLQATLPDHYRIGETRHTVLFYSKP